MNLRDGATIFVLNLGRSGSKAVAEAFDLLHEPDDWKPDASEARKRARKWHQEKGYYGETNNQWRFKLDELLNAFPNATYIHLVRNPIEWMQSYRYRNLHDGETERWHANEPIPVQGFEDMNRHQKMCHHYVHWNNKIEEVTQSRLRLRDITTLFPVRNETASWRENLLYKDWSNEEKEQFWDICGGKMHYYGYITWEQLSQYQREPPEQKPNPPAHAHSHKTPDQS